MFHICALGKKNRMILEFVVTSNRIRWKQSNGTTTITSQIEEFQSVATTALAAEVPASVTGLRVVPSHRRLFRLTGSAALVSTVTAFQFLLNASVSQKLLG